MGHLAVCRVRYCIQRIHRFSSAVSVLGFGRLKRKRKEDGAEDAQEGAGRADAPPQPQAQRAGLCEGVLQRSQARGSRSTTLPSELVRAHWWRTVRCYLTAKRADCPACARGKTSHCDHVTRVLSLRSHAA